MRSLCANAPVFPYLSVAAQEGEECVRRAFEQLRDEVRVVIHVGCTPKKQVEDEETSFPDIMRGMETEAGGEWEGFTFSDIMQPAEILSEALSTAS